MDQIAAEAGVSKLTVYSHFGDKDALFAAAVQAHCEQQLPESLFAAADAAPLREGLLQVARIQLRQYLATPDPIADVDIASHQAATDAEGQHAFLARADFTGKCIHRRLRVIARMRHQHGLRRFRRDIAVAAARLQKRQKHRGQCEACGPCWHADSFHA
jgi:AcrR family transcriptional regulator